ncbi:MAG: hypothetical protein L0Y37_04325, partial [Bacteroidales bacterium]|nr:hypothetical protein [Bacteroidales bacterium]
MGIKNGLLLIFLLTLSPFALLSQVNRSGVPVVRWFDAMETPGDLQNCCIATDKRGVIYFGNESRGIMTYDGLNWGLIKIPAGQRVSAMASDHRGVIYAGITDDFGLLQPDNRGGLSYTSLADRLNDTLARKEVGAISSIVSDSSTVYFTDGRKLYLYDIDGDELSVIDMSEELALRNAFTLLAREGSLIIADN